MNWRCVALAVVLDVLARAAGARADGFEEAMRTITGADIAHHVEILASDAFEGREPGTAGEAKALDYVEEAFRKIGAPPGYHGKYRQPVPLTQLKATGTPQVRFDGGSDRLDFRYRDDFVVVAGRPVASVDLKGLPVVFAGHGITAETYDWDDYAGASVAGAVVVLLRGEPSPPEDTTLFRGRTLTMHGLPSTKYENAARRGARAAIVVHTDATAGYPWSALTGGGLGASQNFLMDDEVPQLDVIVHVNEPAARRLFAAAGIDFDDYVARAGRRGFSPVTSRLRLDARFTASVREFRSANVIARIEGREAPGECVIYTAHWDHVGRNDDLKGDKIFNGAVDNATGTAGLLELAQAFRALPEPPRRTVYFVATTAEEKGLLGSEHLARHPVVPLARTAAVINLDALFPFGSYTAMTVTALGSSEIEDVLAAAAGRIGRILQDDDAPEAGAYYRSDHYPFAKRGVPALFAVGNPRSEDLVEGSPVKKRFDDYLANGYHKPDDEYDPATWDLRGVEEDVRVLFETGWRVANDARFPNWRFDNEFRPLRDRMMAP